MNSKDRQHIDFIFINKFEHVHSWKISTTYKESTLLKNNIYLLFQHVSTEILNYALIINYLPIGN